MSAGNGAPRRVGIDIGGTFTDSVSLDAEGRLVRAKVPSTPDDFARGFLEGARSVAPQMEALALLCHGTTVGTNAVITRNGAATALVTTEGFRDTLLLRRTARAEHFDLWWQPPEPLLSRRDIFEVPERLDYTGATVVALDEEAARACAERIVAGGRRAVAICFLHSFTNPAHERRMKEILLEVDPTLYVSASYEVLPEILEFERTSTTAVNAYLGPVMRDYIGRLREDLEADGFAGELFVSSSTGGALTPESVRALPASTIQSGPAAGVISARDLAERAGFPNVLTFDMGGTSTDVGLILDGEVRRRNDTHVEWGTPVHLPSVDLTSIGAGGGSIAWIDAAGALRSGPQSAGASPGPACYGRGGTEPTTTDAQLALGRLDPKMFLGGKMEIDPELAVESLQRAVAAPLGLDGEVEAASSVIEIAINEIVQCLRAVTTYRGLDPRDFALVSFGGAGGLFAVSVAREAEIPTVIVPPYPGLMSALGLLSMDLRHEIVSPVMGMVGALDEAELGESLGRLSAQARERLAADGIAAGDYEIQFLADVRYYGTTHSLTIKLERPGEGAGLGAEVRAGFEREHEREYGYLIPVEVADVELVNLRAVAIGSLQSLPEPSPQAGESGTEPRPREHRDVYWGEWRSTPVFDREALPLGSSVPGPAIVEQDDATIAIEPGSTAAVDPFGNLVITQTGGEE
jgi:N-methylhydantoinase A